MRKAILLTGIVVVLASLFVSAAEKAPPPLPVEFWGELDMDGSPAADGLQVTAEVDGVDHALETVTVNGMYNIILTEGDRDLTYPEDPNCNNHNPCIPCSGDCVEGPQVGDDIVLKVDGQIAKPYLQWTEPYSTNQDASGITTVTVSLTTGWNLFSLPLIPEDNSLSNVLAPCEGKWDVVWTTLSGDVWRSTDNFFDPLDTIEYDKSYLIYMTDDCELTVTGNAQYKTTIDVTAGWNLIGYPSIEIRAVDDVLGTIDYNIIWKTIMGDVWRSSDNFFEPLDEFEPGYGYEAHFSTGGSYDVIY